MDGLSVSPYGAPLSHAERKMALRGIPNSLDELDKSSEGQASKLDKKIIFIPKLKAS